MSAAEDREVPFFNYPFVFTSHEEQLLETIRDVGRRGAFILQRDLEQFEQQLQNYTGAKHAFGVANGTDALIIALRAAGIGSGDEVIFSSHTYVATAAAIHFVGATPVAVECGADHMIDPAAVEAAITSRTRAIMPTQLNGRTCQMDALQAIADQHDLLIVEDAAQALGSRFRGRAAGTFGIAGTISFYPAKTLGCLGDGGAILTNSDEMAEAIYRLRDHGRGPSGEVHGWGLNSRLDNLQAAILNVKLATYAEDVTRRREIADLYDRLLNDLSQLSLPPRPDGDGDHFDVFQNYEIEADDRDSLQTHLRSRGVGTLVQWGGKTVHQLAGLGIAAELPRTERMIARSLMLPLNVSLSDEDVIYVSQQVRGYYEQQNKSRAA